MILVIRIFLYLVVFCLFSLPVCGESESNTGYPQKIDRLTAGDTVYHQVQVKKVTAKYLLILHSKGFSQVKLADLDEFWQKKFGYSPQAEAVYERRREEERAAAAEARERARQRVKSQRADISSAAGESEDGSRILTRPWPTTPPEWRRSVDLRPLFSRFGLGMKDQNRRSSCSVFSTVMAYEYEWARKSRKGVEFSEEFLIWAVRQFDESRSGFGQGFSLFHVAMRIQKSGLPDNDSYSEAVKGDFSRPPPAEAIAQAKSRAGCELRWMVREDDPELMLNQAIHALNAGHPVVIGLDWPHARTLQNTALLDKQIPVDKHAVTLIGYTSDPVNPDALRLIFKNSWGRTWGVNGCGYMSRDYFLKNVMMGLTFELH